VTDGAKRWQEEKLRRLGIAPFFDRIIISGEVGSSKLNDENFRMALEGGEDRVYVVGDRLETDIRGGNAIGATTILVRRGTFAYDRETDIVPDVTVTSLAELYRVFPVE
ncbi:MAG: HAD family hydrolase, partial [Candidatus Methanofastidiosa archaeon]|nr:HAD family hydrolase [Candidatus Methanofastidiosa archaeon]